MLSLLLALCMVFSMLPVSAFAVEGESGCACHGDECPGHNREETAAVRAYNGPSVAIAGGTIISDTIQVL